MAITNYQEYPMEQIEFLRKTYPQNGLKKTHELFNNKFGYHTESQVKHRILKFGIKSNYCGKFQKGRQAWNDGINLKEDRPDIYNQLVKSQKGWFKKGRLPKNTKPVGSEKVYKDIVFIKVAMPNVWKVKARYVYEQAHNCILQSNEKIIHLDGDYRNCDIDNLFKVDDAMIVRLNQKGMRFNNKDLTKSAVYLELLERQIKELEDGKNNI